MTRPTYPVLIRQAIESLGGQAANRDIKDWIVERYPDANISTIDAQINALTVNSPSRVHAPENQRPRTGPHPTYDVLYRVGRGQVVTYEPEVHGQWAIQADEGGLRVVQVVDTPDDSASLDSIPTVDTGDIHDTITGAFAMETHLRDFLARNLDGLEPGLTLYRDATGREGVEFPTDVGPVDLLAIDAAGDFVVIELKVLRTSDHTCGQLMRYMGWIRRHIAQGHDVRGIIVASRIDRNLRYAATEAPKVRLFEYELTFRVTPVSEPAE